MLKEYFAKGKCILCPDGVGLVFPESAEDGLTMSTTLALEAGQFHYLVSFAWNWVRLFIVQLNGPIMDVMQNQKAIKKRIATSCIFSFFIYFCCNRFW